MPSGKQQKREDRRGAGRPNVKPLGMNDPYGINIAPLNIFKIKALPIGVQKMSKTFRSNMATIRVFIVGHKNLEISKQDYKTIWFIRKPLREHFVSANNLISKVVMWLMTHLMKWMKLVGNKEAESLE